MCKMGSTDETCETLILPEGDHLIVRKVNGGNVYMNKKHSGRFGTNIRAIQNQELLCDVTLVADHTEEIRAHKVVLAASSLFFYTIFSSIFGKSEERIVLDGVDRFALPQIVEYIYTGKIFITEDNVERLFRAAHKLVVIDVFNACAHFMQTHLTAENCFNIAALAKEHECVDLVSETETFMTEHFCGIVRTQTFLDLSKETLIEIIKSDKLKVTNEIVVFNAVVSWVKYMIEIRQQYLAPLMEYVRFPLLSTEDLLEKVEQEPLFTNNTLCFKYIRETMRYHLMKDPVNKKSTFSSPRTRPRVLTDLSEATSSADAHTKHFLQKKKMLVVVGMEVTHEISMEKYDFEDERWLQGPEMFKRPSRTDSFLLNTEEKIYMIGGWGDESRKVDVFDLKHGKWMECNDLLENRHSTAAAFLDGDIYVSGGGWPAVKSSEKLDQQTGRWVKIADMLQRRRYHSMCAMDGKVYAVGGSDSFIGPYLLSVEYYNPVTNSWTRVPDMSIERSYHGVAGLDGKLYVVGGSNGNGSLKCVEVFNSVDQKWTRLADLNVARQRPSGVVAANGLIYVAGGYDHKDNYLNSVEVYDPRINTWTMLTIRMGEGKTNVTAAVIDWPF